LVFFFVMQVHKEKTGVDGDSEQTESDNVGDGKEDTEGGKDDLNDAKEDLQDGTGGDDAFVEHGAAPLAESPLVSPDSQIVPFEPVEKSFATPDVPSATVERPPLMSDFVPASTLFATATSREESREEVGAAEGKVHLSHVAESPEELGKTP
jgi:hypothetical protein